MNKNKKSSKRKELTPIIMSNQSNILKIIFNTFNKKLIMEEKKKESPKRKWFNEYWGDLNESEIQKEILFAQLLTNDKLEKVRSNTSKIVWWIIVIPIIVAVIFGMF